MTFIPMRFVCISCFQVTKWSQDITGWKYILTFWLEQDRTSVCALPNRIPDNLHIFRNSWDVLKGIIHKKIEILSLFTPLYVVPNQHDWLPWNKKDILIMDWSRFWNVFKMWPVPCTKLTHGFRGLGIHSSSCMKKS